MADTKISALTALTGANVADDDVYPIVDTSVTTTKKIAASELRIAVGMPPGIVLPYAGTAAPFGWLLCYGQAVSQATYAALYAVIGTTFGPDSGGNFTLPDARGRVIAGQDDMGGSSANRLTGQSGGVDGDTLGATGGAETHTLVVSEIPAHTHTILTGPPGGGYADPAYNSNDPRAMNSTSSSTGGDGAHNNVQPTIILNYIIKT
jgi:microcystin-dependent protein